MKKIWLMWGLMILMPGVVMAQEATPTFKPTPGPTVSVGTLGSGTNPSTGGGTCTPRPPCLDATPKCLMPELESYCPRVLKGDANGSGTVDLTDFDIWKNEYLGTLTTKTADFNNSGVVDLTDFDIWKNAYLNGTGSSQNTSFGDVPSNYWAANQIGILKALDITSGCGGGNYCPEAKINRAELAVLLLKSKHGGNYVPPVATSTFSDVSSSFWAKDWVEEMKTEGITAGCGAGIYCPDKAVTRAEMAVFLLRAKNGGTYDPGVLPSTFGDVPTSYWASKWIEKLALDGVTSGCGGGNYCPDKTLSRAEAAVFLVKNFGLSI